MQPKAIRLPAELRHVIFKQIRSTWQRSQNSAAMYLCYLNEIFFRYRQLRAERKDLSDTNRGVTHPPRPHAISRNKYIIKFSKRRYLCKLGLKFVLDSCENFTNDLLWGEVLVGRQTA